MSLLLDDAHRKPKASVQNDTLFNLPFSFSAFLRLYTLIFVHFLFKIRFLFKIT